MKELLHRPATEFGLYFGMLPLGFIIGTIISSPAWAIASVELFVVVGIRDAAGAFSARLLHDVGAGNFLPYAQAGAMATVPALAGTAAGIGVFVQNFLGAGFAQMYGLFADGSPIPMMKMTAITVGLGLVSAALPSLLPRSKGT